MPTTRHDLLASLGAMGIATVTRDHPPLRTVAESQALRGEIPGRHTKNLFLKDRKDNFFLVTAGEDAEIDLKSIHQIIGAAGKVSFGSPERLMDLLGVAPGSVSPFCVVNDTGGRVTAILDEELMGHAVVNAHPLTNKATTSIAPADLERFMASTGHAPRILSVQKS